MLRSGILLLPNFYAPFAIFWAHATLKFCYFWATFQNLAKNRLKQVLNMIFLSFNVYIFNFSEALDVGLMRFQNFFDVDLFCFSKIWVLWLKISGSTGCGRACKL